MGCANSVAENAELKKSSLTDFAELPKLVDVSVQKEDEEISPLQPHHYNGERKTIIHTKKFVFSDQDGDSSIKKGGSSQEDKLRSPMIKGVERAGTLELDNFELKNEIISKSDNLDSGEAIQGSQKHSMELNLDHFEAFSLIHENKYVIPAEGHPKKQSDSRNPNQTKPVNSMNLQIEHYKDHGSRNPMFKRGDTVTELMIDTFKVDPLKENVKEIKEKNQGTQITPFPSLIAGASPPKDRFQKELKLNHEKGGNAFSQKNHHKDQYQLSKMVTELPGIEAKSNEITKRTRIRKGKSKTAVNFDRKMKEYQEREWQPLEEFLDTVVKALQQHRENKKNTLDPRNFPGRRLTRCLTSSPLSYSKSSRLNVIINNFKNNLKSKVAAKKNGVTETQSRQTFNPRRNYRTIKQTPLISQNPNRPDQPS